MYDSSFGLFYPNTSDTPTVFQAVFSAKIEVPMNTDNTIKVDEYFVPLDPMDAEGMRCESCE